MANQTFKQVPEETLELEIAFDNEAQCNSTIQVVANTVDEVISIYEVIVSCDQTSFIRLTIPNDDIIEARYTGGTTLHFQWFDNPIVLPANTPFNINNLSPNEEFMYFVRYTKG